MKRIFYYLATAYVLSLNQAGNSQSYNLTIANEPYNSINDDTLLVSGDWAELEFIAPIGFELDYFGRAIDSLYSFDFFAGEYFGTNPNQAAMDLILAFSTDLVDRGYEIDSSLSPVSYKTEGEQGNRVFTLEFRNAGFQSGSINFDGIYIDYINFQLKLYEVNSNVSVHIGPYSVTNPALDFAGFSGPSIGLLQEFNFNNATVLGEVFILAGDPLNPDILTDFEKPENLAWPIPENTVYTFSPKSTSFKEKLLGSDENYFFPNPTSGKLYLLPEIVMNIPSSINVFNTLGDLVATTYNSEIIDLTNLHSGIYEVYFQTTSGICVQTISLIK